MKAPSNEIGSRPSPALVALLALGLAALSVALYLSPFFHSSDFLGFYAGATLAMRGEFFHADAIEQLETKYGRLPQSKPFHRPPFYTLAISPLALLPYRQAFVVWQAINVLALGAFLWLWPFRWRFRAAALSLWFAPLWIAILVAQDAAIFLACLALAARLLDRDRPFWAGVILAVCCFKANLLLALPVVLLVRRQWQVCAGLIAGGIALYLVSALAAGPAWPLDYLATLRRTSNVLPAQTYFATIAGLAQSLPASLRWVRWPAVGAVLCLLAVACRRLSLAGALGLAVMAGLLISPFAFLYDAVAMLPAMIATTDFLHPFTSVIPIGLAAATLTIMDPHTAWIGQTCLILIFIGAVCVSIGRRRDRQRMPQEVLS